MIFGSVCSGIEAASVAWHPLGWKASFFSEIEKFPSAVLAHHYPDVPNLGDMTKFKEWPDAAIDVLVGGTPCQSFSIAGLRKGLDDPRGNLMLTYLAIANRYRPKWVVWENVPGVLSSNGGRDFGTFLGALGQLGYGWSYRVLDAQYFGVAQRRRRVFVVGHLGDWQPAAAVLFERHSLQGHPAPRREKRQAVAALTANGVGTCGADDNKGQAGHLVSAYGGGSCSGSIDTSTALTAHGTRQDFDTETFIAHTLRGEGFDASEDGTGRGTPLVPVAFSSKDYGGDATEDLSPTLRASGHNESHANAGAPPAVAIQEVGKRTGTSTDDKRCGIGISNEGDPMFTLQVGAQHGVIQAQAVSLRGREGGATAELGDEISPALRCGGGGGDKRHVLAETADTLAIHWHNRNGAKAGNNAGMINPIINQMAVRRLTPIECERLQGFPDNYTLLPEQARKKIEDDYYQYLLRRCPWLTRDEAERMAKDGPRYKALGNSMCAGYDEAHPGVMRWIGQRIQMVDEILREEVA